MRFLILALLCSACAGAQSTSSSVEVADAQFVMSEMKFMFPQRMAEVERRIELNKYARLRAADLGLEINDDLVEHQLGEIVQQLQASSRGSLDELAQAEYELPWQQVADTYRQHLANNLLYRSVYVADARQMRQLTVAVLGNSQLAVVEGWHDELQLGRHPEGLGAETVTMPEWRTDVYVPGSIVGPFRLLNGLWMIGRVTDVAPSAGRLEWSETQQLATKFDISPFVAEVWIHEMASRYNIDE